MLIPMHDLVLSDEKARPADGPNVQGFQFLVDAKDILEHADVA